MARRLRKPPRHELKGWHKTPGSAIVTRPSRFGNPYKARPWGPYEPAEAVALYRRDLEAGGVLSAPGRTLTTVDEIRRQLAGLDLLCTCPPGQPCHADVLLEVAGQGGHAAPGRLPSRSGFGSRSGREPPRGWMPVTVYHQMSR